jgi:hypothetical protein
MQNVLDREIEPSNLMGEQDGDKGMQLLLPHSACKGAFVAMSVVDFVITLLMQVIKL